MLPPDKVIETADAGPSAPFPSNEGTAEALEERGSAFSSLLRADVGRAVGASIKSVTVRGVFPAGETAVDWSAWRQWGAGALNVSLGWGGRDARWEGKGKGGVHAAVEGVAGPMETGADKISCTIVSGEKCREPYGGKRVTLTVVPSTRARPSLVHRLPAGQR